MSQLFLSYNVRTGKWIVEQEYYNRIAKVRIPQGFKTDLASIPRCLWSFIANYELSEAAPLVHDYLYHYASGSRKQADKYFLAIMKEEGVSFWKRKVAYYAVRLFAGVVWKRNK